MPATFTLERTAPLPPERLLVRLADPESWTPGSRVTSTGDPEVAPSPEAPLNVRAAVPFDPSQLPSAARGMLPERPEVEQQWSFSSPVDGTLAATVPGAPAQASAIIRLEPTAAGTLLRAEITLSCDIPLFGGLVEQAMKPIVVEQIDAQLARL